MKQEEKQLLLKDLCARLPYHPIVSVAYNYAYKGIVWGFDVLRIKLLLEIEEEESWEYIKPYLRPMSSMTEEEVKEVSILYGIKDILSIKITDEYIDVVVDDGFYSTETRTIWYDEIISSIEIFDWCNKNHFDYRGLIPLGLAIEATEGMYKKGE